MAHTLTIGKLRGLRQISTEGGIFTMAAEDQRGSMRRMLNPSDPKGVLAAHMTEVKLDIARALSPLASAMLIDPEYGAAQAISTGALAGHCGLLVSLEDSDYEQVGDDRRAKILEGWGVEKIKRMGASGVKLLAYFRPDRGPGTTYQRDLIARVGEECQKHDIPFILECVGYAVGGMKTDSPEYAALKPEIVIETARMVSGLGVDVYKAEFPADSTYEKDEGKLLDLCKSLDEACEVPWVVLSAGVEIEIFREQVRLACRGGASGFLGGRAIWKNAVRLPAEERRRFLATEGKENLRSLIEIAQKYARPWTERPNRGLQRQTIDDTWYRAY
jgi:tagatose 1,6-diphosphate aldolase